jgi:dephospho-CoA kinase
MIIRNTLCVAGPPAAGKSTLMQTLQAGALTGLAPELDDVAEWTFASLKGSRDFESRYRGASIDLVLHVDLAMFSGPKLAKVARLREFLNASQAIYVLTLWAPPDVLVARLDERTAAWFERTSQDQEPRKLAGRRRGRRDSVGNAPVFDSMYDAWFALTAQYAVKHSWWVDATRPDLVVTPAETFRPLSWSAWQRSSLG